MMFPTDRLDSGHVRRLTVEMTFLNRSNEDIRHKQRHTIQIRPRYSKYFQVPNSMRIQLLQAKKPCFLQELDTPYFYAIK